jgi:methyl-accepting chemotaxis protein
MIKKVGQAFRQGFARSIAVMASGKWEKVNKRQTWIINPKFQYKVILCGLSIGSIALILTFIANKMFFSRCYDVLLRSGIGGGDLLWQFMGQQERIMGGLFLGVLLIVMVISGLLGLIISHRIAGPMYKLHQSFQAVADGKRSHHLTFREEDFFHEIADIHNQAFSIIEKKPE